MTRDSVFALISAERQAQIDKWGHQRELHPSLWFLSLGEEVGEVANAILELKEFDSDLRERTAARAHLLEEIVQVAAVAVAWLEEGF